MVLRNFYIVTTHEFESLRFNLLAKFFSVSAQVSVVQKIEKRLIIKQDFLLLFSGDGCVGLEEYRLDCANRMAYGSIQDLDAAYEKLLSVRKIVLMIQNPFRLNPFRPDCKTVCFHSAVNKFSLFHFQRIQPNVKIISVKKTLAKLQADDQKAGGITLKRYQVGSFSSLDYN